EFGIGPMGMWAAGCGAVGFGHFVFGFVALGIGFLGTGFWALWLSGFGAFGLLHDLAAEVLAFRK
ncbi:hypothetical protein U1Q18_034362, partial [Sarracenia purpurea var. burkii]